MAAHPSNTTARRSKTDAEKTRREMRRASWRTVAGTIIAALISAALIGYAHPAPDLHVECVNSVCQHTLTNAP